MERQTVPIPAESLRTIARNAADNVTVERQAGRINNAKELERQVSEAFMALNGEAGEFVSIEANTLSSLAAFGGMSDEAWKHRKCARHFLEQYGVW